MTDLSLWAHLACAAAAVVGGVVNAIAGGGTLISFPMMTAVGIPSVHATATNKVALCPGYLGGTHAQREDLRGLGPELRTQLILSAICGLLGAILLVVTSEAVFRSVVPFLILASCGLLFAQVPLRTWLFGRGERRSHRSVELACVALSSVYGGYFGAGYGIVLLAILGLLSDRPLAQVNAIKQLISLIVNVCAAAFLVFSDRIEWTIVAVMAPAALLGGNLGGRLATVLPAGKLRPAVGVFGVFVAIAYLVG